MCVACGAPLIEPRRRTCQKWNYLLADKVIGSLIAVCLLELIYDVTVAPLRLYCSSARHQAPGLRNM